MELSTLMWIAIGASAAGTAVATVSEIQKGQAEKQIAEANASLADQQAVALKQQAELEREQGVEEARVAQEESFKLSRQRREMIGKQALLYGAAGVGTSGSPLDVMADTAGQFERDIGFAGIKADQAIRAGERQAYTSDYNAWMQEQNARIYRYQGKQAATAGWITGGSTLLTGAGRGLMMYQVGTKGTK